ncbi:hypothetical protein R1sor_016175 [Riccia sorocarpa]|uniref:NADH kinase n=1 Tax=Riccia sorocarpa TaxID=122646 RepID=A0ABD3HG37_9MARC
MLARGITNGWSTSDVVWTQNYVVREGRVSGGRLRDKPWRRSCCISSGKAKLAWSRWRASSSTRAPIRNEKLAHGLESTEEETGGGRGGAGRMATKRVLLLLKRSMLDGYVPREAMSVAETPFASLLVTHPKVVGNLPDRHRVHSHTVEVCKDVLRRRANVEWDSIMRDELQGCPIRKVDLVVTIGGDGTLLQASNCLDDSIPILGVNSDPTISSEVEEHLHQFDATRSTGYLCAATADNFEQILDDILDGKKKPLELTRINTRIDGEDYSYPALNDVLLSHPNPAAVSRCSYRIYKEGVNEPRTPLVHSRSSGLRICTAAGSTAAMASAGGEPMDLLSRDLQFMIREPISPHPRFREYLKGWITPTEVLKVRWCCRQGVIHFDGSHVSQQVKFGSVIEFSSNAPLLKIFARDTKKDEV